MSSDQLNNQEVTYIELMCPNCSLSRNFKLLDLFDVGYVCCEKCLSHLAILTKKETTE